MTDSARCVAILFCRFIISQSDMIFSFFDRSWSELYVWYHLLFNQTTYIVKTSHTKGQKLQETTLVCGGTCLWSLWSGLVKIKFTIKFYFLVWKDRYFFSIISQLFYFSSRAELVCFKKYWFFSWTLSHVFFDVSLKKQGP